MNIPNVTNTRAGGPGAPGHGGQVGSMKFDHAPRVYYGWVPDGE